MVKRSFGFKMVFVFLVMAFLIATGLGVFAVTSMKQEIGKLSYDKLKTDYELAYKSFDREYPGDWELKNGDLYKGNSKVTLEKEYLQRMTQLTDTSIIITLKNNRTIKTGDKYSNKLNAIPEDVFKKVMAGKITNSLATIDGKNYRLESKPLTDKYGEIIAVGSLYAPESQYESVHENLQQKMMIGAYIALIIASLIFWLITRIISRPIVQIVDGMTKVERGDLTVNLDIKTNDEFTLLGRKFNAMIQNLAAMTRNIVKIAEKVALSAEQLSATSEEASRATEQIATTINQVATGTEKQVKSVEETSATINEMSDGLQHVAVNSHTVMLASNQANDSATNGGDYIDKSVAQMESINDIVKELAEKIKSLGCRSQQIGYIVEVITNIAKQTNLLALNAAIEAARAGEQGRGFAVVAEEVRKLAEQSAQAANQISDLIREIQEETNKSVTAMDDSAEKIASGARVVFEAGEAFETIMEAIKKVTVQTQEVSASTEEMAAGAQQVVSAVIEISSISQETASSAQEVAAAAQEQTASIEEVASSANLLARLAEDLRNQVKHFKVDEFIE